MSNVNGNTLSTASSENFKKIESKKASGDKPKETIIDIDNHFLKNKKLVEDFSSSDEYFWEEESELDELEHNSFNSESNQFHSLYDSVANNKFSYSTSTKIEENAKSNISLNKNNNSLQSLDSSDCLIKDEISGSLMDDLQKNSEESPSLKNSRIQSSFLHKDPAVGCIKAPFSTYRSALKTAKVKNSTLLNYEICTDKCKEPKLKLTSKSPSTFASRQNENDHETFKVSEKLFNSNHAANCFSITVDKTETKKEKDKANSVFSIFQRQEANQSIVSNKDNAELKDDDRLDYLPVEVQSVKKAIVTKTLTLSYVPEDMENLSDSSEKISLSSFDTLDADIKKTQKNVKEQVECFDRSHNFLEKKEQETEQSWQSPPYCLSPWQWFQQCCNEANFATTRQTSDDDGRVESSLHQPLKIKVTEMVESYNENAKQNSQSVEEQSKSLFQSKQSHFTSSKIKKLVNTFEKRSKSHLTDSVYGFADSFLDDIINGRDKMNEKHCLGHQSFEADKSSQINSFSNDFHNSITEKLTPSSGKHKNTIFDSENSTKQRNNEIQAQFFRDISATLNKSKTFQNLIFKRESQSSNKNINYPPKFPLCFGKTPCEIRHHFSFLKDFLTSNGINFESTSLDEIIQVKFRFIAT